MPEATRDRRFHNLWPSSNLAEKESLVVVPILGCVMGSHTEAVRLEIDGEWSAPTWAVYEVEP